MSQDYRDNYVREDVEDQDEKSRLYASILEDVSSPDQVWFDKILRKAADDELNHDGLGVDRMDDDETYDDELEELDIDMVDEDMMEAQPSGSVLVVEKGIGNLNVADESEE